jgi:hypothetical protein
LLTKPRLHRLLDVTMQAEPVPHVPTWVVGFLWSRHPSSGCVGPCVMQWAIRSAFIRYTCSSFLKAFYTLVSLSLMHGACSILCQHSAVDFRRFNPLCPQKTHYGALFLDGAVAEWSGHTLHSLLSAMWLNDGMLRAARYTSSLADMWCCASAPLSCF